MAQISLYCNKGALNGHRPVVRMTQDAKTRERSDQGFVSRLADESYRELFGYLLRRLGNESDVQDLAQEAYLRLLRVEKGDLIRNPRAYLFRIAANLVYEFRMKEGRSAPFDGDPQPEIDAAPTPTSLEGSLESRDTLRHLGRVLQDQPPLYRAVLLMRKRDGMSHDEIAEKLGVSVHTVRKYLTRAVAECRAALKTG